VNRYVVLLKVDKVENIKKYILYKIQTWQSSRNARQQRSYHLGNQCTACKK